MHNHDCAKMFVLLRIGLETNMFGVKTNVSEQLFGDLTIGACAFLHKSGSGPVHLCTDTHHH